MRYVVIVAALVVAGAAAIVTAQSGMSKTDRELCAQMLKDIQADLEKNYYDPSFRGIDVAARFNDAREKLAAAQTAVEAGDILANTLFQFGDSHTNFIPPPRATRVDYGWKMAVVGDVAMVVEVTAGSDADRQGLAPGDRVVAVNRFQPARDNLWQIQYYYRVVRPQAQQRITVRKPDGGERVLDIASRVERRDVIQLSDALDELESDGESTSQMSGRLEPGILVWRLRSFDDAAVIEAAIGRARTAAALVLDLRGNPGGDVEALKDLVGWTFDRDIHVLTMKTRKGEKKQTARRNGKAFSGRLIVLVDSRSASASEVYSRIVQIEKRGTVIGDRTAGMVMVSEIFAHTFGVGNVTAYGSSITVGDVRMSDGGSLERVGVTPDELVLPTQADLAARRDPALARAIALAGGSITPEEAGRLFDRKR